MAFALTPEPPIVEWLAELDSWIRNSAAFFVGRPVVLDLTSVKLSGAAITHLVSELETRNIRIMGIEGADQADLGPKLPPVLKGGRTAAIDLSGPSTTSKRTQTPRPEATSLLLETPVRSGQSVVFPHGDVTVVGSVGSGAEVIAGGSIHVYGPLRGRALAGSNGDPRARIFCTKAEPELLCINGYYRTAENIDAALHGRPIQAWLDGNVLTMMAMD